MGPPIQSRQRSHSQPGQLIKYCIMNMLRVSHTHWATFNEDNLPVVRVVAVEIVAERVEAVRVPVVVVMPVRLGQPLGARGGPADKLRT